MPRQCSSAFSFLSKQCYPGFIAYTKCLTVPSSGLHFAYMSTAHKQHAETRLTYTAADGKRQLSAEQRLVEGQLPSFLAACLGKLARKAFGVHTYTHGRYFKRAL